jgi:hypothetical protein
MNDEWGVLGKNCKIPQPAGTPKTPFATEVRRCASDREWPNAKITGSRFRQFLPKTPVETGVTPRRDAYDLTSVRWSRAKLAKVGTTLRYET